MAKKGSMIPEGYEIYFKWVLAIILFCIGVPIVTGQIQKWKDEQNAKNAANAAPGAVAANNPAAGSSAARANKIKGWADTLHGYFDSWFNKSGAVVALLNSLLLPEDVAALSAYYQQSYGESLKAMVNSETNSFANTSGKDYDDLKKFVQENLD
jgi:hypothetical protein